MGKYRDRFMRTEANEKITSMKDDFEKITEDMESHTAEENIKRLIDLGSNHCFAIAKEFSKIK